MTLDVVGLIQLVFTLCGMLILHEGGHYITIWLFKGRPVFTQSGIDPAVKTRNPHAIGNGWKHCVVSLSGLLPSLIIVPFIPFPLWCGVMLCLVFASSDLLRFFAIPILTLAEHQGYMRWYWQGPLWWRMVFFHLDRNKTE